jgi:DNA-damage-inducible protein J
MPSDTVVRARIDSATKERAALALDSMGLSISDAIRLLLARVASNQEILERDKIPNKITRNAMRALEQGKGKRFETIEALFKDLGI